MASEDEFVERWRKYVAGTIALGHASMRIYMLGSAKEKHPAEAVLEKLDSEAIDLLKKLYRDLTKKEATNGRTHQGNGSAQAPARATLPNGQEQATQAGR